MMIAGENPAEDAKAGLSTPAVGVAVACQQARRFPRSIDQGERDISKTQDHDELLHEVNLGTGYVDVNGEYARRGRAPSRPVRLRGWDSNPQPTDQQSVGNLLLPGVSGALTCEVVSICIGPFVSFRGLAVQARYGCGVMSD